MPVLGLSPADLLNRLARRRGWTVTSSISYATGPRHTLDVYAPAGATGAPVILFFYGGNWESGSKETYPFLAAAFAARGYVTIVPDYRVYPQVRFPGFLTDAAQAVAWVKANVARFGGAPDMLFLMGHSAGAHIAAMLTLDGQWLGQVSLESRRAVAGLIGIAGPYDFLPLRSPTLKQIFAVDDLALTQPITFVSGGEPPALLVAGQRDAVVDPGNSIRLAARLRGAGSDATAVIYPRIGHAAPIGAFAPILRFLAPMAADVDRFVARVRGTHQRETELPF